MCRPTLNITKALITSARPFHTATNIKESLCSYNACTAEVLHFFRSFQSTGSDPNEFTISKALSACTKLNALEEGNQVHAFLLKRNVVMDVVATNSLIDLYAKCGIIEDAERIFHEMQERDVYTWTVMVSGYVLNSRVKQAMGLFDEMPRRNIISWNSVINACETKGHGEMALGLFSRMRKESEPSNKSTFISVLKACNNLDTLSQIHCILVKSSWIENVILACTLTDMYAKFGNMLDSCKSFYEIREHNIDSWSILLAGFAKNGKVVDAENIFEAMPERNVVSWNIMIANYVQNGMQDKAFRLLIEMRQAGMQPNCFTMTSLLSGCSFIKYALKGKCFHGYTIKIGLQLNTSISSALITMYGEQGNIGDARAVFEAMRSHNIVSSTAMMSAYISNRNAEKARHIFDIMPEKNLITFNTMMYGHVQDAKAVDLKYVSEMKTLDNPVDDALMLFYNMERSKIKPDHFSYNCALTACSNGEALEQAKAIHCKAIKRGFDSDIGVCNALITVYGKCGSLNEAKECFDKMASHDIISWNALLTCYVQNGQGNEALQFYEEMKNLEQDPNYITFISLLSACSYIGEVQKGFAFFDEMEKDYGIKPNKEHYTCMVDLLGRAGLFHEAEALIDKMPFKPDATVWRALLGACKMHGDTVIGGRAANEIFLLDPNDSAAHVALAEAFAAARMWEDVAKIRTAIRGKRLVKEPGCSWIDVRNQRHVFLSGDHFYLQKDCIHESLSILYYNMIDEGYILNAELLGDDFNLT